MILLCWYLPSPSSDVILNQPLPLNSLPLKKTQKSLTSKVIYDISRRLTEEDKNLQTYRRAVAFSHMIQKDLLLILVNSMHIEVFDAVIRLVVNLTVPVEYLCPLKILTKSEDGREANIV